MGSPVIGPDGVGATPTGPPVRVGGTYNGVVKALATDSSGNLLVTASGLASEAQILGGDGLTLLDVLVLSSLTGASKGIAVRVPGVSLTASAPTFYTAGVASGSALASNANRKGLVLVNTSSNLISLAIGQAAVLGSGISLNANGGVWEMDLYTFTTGEIRAIAAGASSNLAIQEWT